MKAKGLIKRNFLEIMRDPLSTMLGILFPSLLLILFSIIDATTNMPIDMFKAINLVPGIIVLGQCLLMMFGAMLLAKDKQTSLFARLQTLPLTAFDFLIGYAVPLLPLGLLQIGITYLIGFIFGLPLCFGLLTSLIYLLPISIIFISIGIIMGTVFSESQISAVGTLLINVCTLFSGAWFDIDFMGGFVKAIAYAMPFAHSVKASRLLINSNQFDVVSLLVILGYTIVFVCLAVFVFYKKLKMKDIHSKQKNK